MSHWSMETFSPCLIAMHAPQTLDSQPIQSNCEIARTNRNCTRLDRWAWLSVTAVVEDGSGSRTYLRDRNCS